MALAGALSTKTVTVPHLTGSKISYYLPKPVVGSKPTLILINPWLSSASFFRKQFEDPELADKVNLVAFEPLGHGKSSTKNTQYTLWNSAIAFVQAMDALGIKSAVVLGVSVGGAIATRMALHAPTRIVGVVAVCTNLSVGARAVELGSTDLESGMIDLVKKTAAPDENFALSQEWLSNIGQLFFGPSAPAEDATFAAELVNRDFSGEEGRKRFRQVTIGLVSRDSLHLRLEALAAPVLWIRGSEDHVYSEAAAKDDIAQITNASTQLETIQGAYHAPTWSHAAQVNPLLLEFVKKHSGVKDARALREAVGMIDM